jgi:hypothetical protein
MLLRGGCGQYTRAAALNQRFQRTQRNAQNARCLGVAPAMAQTKQHRRALLRTQYGKKPVGIEPGVGGIMRPFADGNIVVAEQRGSSPLSAVSVKEQPPANADKPRTITPLAPKFIGTLPCAHEHFLRQVVTVCRTGEPPEEMPQPRLVAQNEQAERGAIPLPDPRVERSIFVVGLIPVQRPAPGRAHGWSERD